MRVVCHSLKVDDLFLILKSSEGSIIRQYEQDFAAYGIEVLFPDEGLRRIAERAAEEQTGARGLMTVCERVFRDIKFELPSTKVRRFVVTRELVDDPAAELQKILAEPRPARNASSRGNWWTSLRGASSRDARHEPAVHGGGRRPAGEARRWSRASRCATCAPSRFKDFQFGLKLIAQNSGQQRVRH